MRIEVTVSASDTCRDVVIDAAESTPMSALIPALAHAIGVADGISLWHRDDLVLPDAAFGSVGLRDGSVLAFGRAQPRRARHAVLSLHVVAGVAAGHTVALERGDLLVGRDDSCDIVLPDVSVSRSHARIQVGAGAITLHDLGSTNGTRVDDRAVPAEGVELRVGSVVSIGDSVLAIAGPSAAPAAVQRGLDATVLLLRSPRRRPVVAVREIVVPSRPSAHRARGVQWAAALLPAAAGGALAWWSGSAQFLIFALLSPLMLISSALGDRLHWRRSRRREARSYRQRRAAADAEIAAALVTEAQARRAAAPDAAALLTQAALPGSALWERGVLDPDALHVRIGLASLPASLMVRDGPIVGSAGVLPRVPLAVDLRRGPLGVAGPADIVAAVGRWLIGQLASLRSPADVEFAVFLDPVRQRDWQWARWLPHVGGRVAASEDEWRELAADLTAKIEHRSDDRRHNPGSWSGPWLVVVVDRCAGLADVPSLSALLSCGAAAGVTALCFDTDPVALPGACASVARVQGAGGARALVHAESDAGPVEAALDQVSPAWADELARSMAPLRDATAAGAAPPPDACPLLELLGMGSLDPRDIDLRWDRATGGARATLGRTGQSVLEVDLAVDGPHALVAGTTGSGKSELLQTLVAGLAANHPPDELNFLLVDYKGGAAFAECARLPHTAGLVTDLDPYLTERALRSLDSELRRRERLFEQSATSDLTEYRARGAGVIARLVIVVDEFAALAHELPDFVRGLVGVAQRGRSLGVHLVLATQRPGSAVSPEIRANTSLRIALRVTDPAESSDVIGAPVAASIERTPAGRGYLRAGTELTCFQAGHASAVTPHDATAASVQLLGPWRRRPARMTGPDGPTDLARLVDALSAAAMRTGRTRAQSPWLAPLPDVLPRAELGETGATTSVALGWVDLPDEQRRAELVVDLTAGSSLLFAGGAGSGRTRALAALAVGAAAQLAPQDLQIQVIDAAGALTAIVGRLPHCATVLTPDDLDLAPLLLRRLADMGSHRRAAGAHGSPSRPRAKVLVLIDGWDSLIARLSDVDAASAVDALGAIVRLGADATVSVAITGDRAALASRLAGGFAERILLRLPDRADYGLAGVRPRDVPATLPPGRGLRASDGALVQFAALGADPSTDETERAVTDAARRWLGQTRATPAAQPKGTGAQPGTDDTVVIRPLPALVVADLLPSLAGRFVLGLGGDRAEPVAWEPFAGTGRMLIAGPPRSGRSTLLRLILGQAHAAQLSALVAAPSRSPLAALAAQLGVAVLTPGERTEAAPTPGSVLLIDDCEAFTDTAAGDQLDGWVRRAEHSLAVAAAGRADELATSYRGVGAEVRRSRCGVLLRPGPVDGELLGVRLARRTGAGLPGRGVAVGDAGWGQLFATGEPVPLQVAMPP